MTNGRFIVNRPFLHPNRSPAVERYKVPRWYVSNRRHLENNFTPENYQGVVEKSAYADHIFVIEKYQKGNGTWHQHYFRGTIYRKDGTEVATIESNACQFWYCWVEKENNLYLLCNEDSYGYTLVDVKEGKTYTYVDPKAREGWAFSWRNVKPSPDGRYLAVQGTYMTHLNEIVLYEFDPDRFPLRKKKRLDQGFLPNSLTLHGWNDDRVVMDQKVGDHCTTVEVGV